VAVLERSTDMVTLPGGTFTMGSDRFYPEEAPVHPVAVDAFRIDRRPVTVARFREFVAETGHVTVAERAPDAADYPDADPALLVPGSLVFRPTTGPVDTRDVLNWWHWVPGACWHAPEGPGSSVAGRHKHPVTQVAYADATAYAQWAGKDLPTEAEWEYAARGGLDAATYAWGDEFMVNGRVMANTWHGRFPYENLRPHGFTGTSPVGAFAANGFGLFDVCGNVWEWTADFHAAHPAATHACCAPHNPRVPEPLDGEPIPRRVIKGGSHLCAPSYCHRYRPAARQGEAIDTSTTHIGFRCVVR
jgi:formylglycine-generating enzyme required for sulfatase activity